MLNWYNIFFFTIYKLQQIPITIALNSRSYPKLSFYNQHTSFEQWLVYKNLSIALGSIIVLLNTEYYEFTYQVLSIKCHCQGCQKFFLSSKYLHNPLAIKTPHLIGFFFVDTVLFRIIGVQFLTVLSNFSFVLVSNLIHDITLIKYVNNKRDSLLTQTWKLPDLCFTFKHNLIDSILASCIEGFPSHIGSPNCFSSFPWATSQSICL